MLIGESGSVSIKGGLDIVTSGRVSKTDVFLNFLVPSKRIRILSDMPLDEDFIVVKGSPDGPNTAISGSP